MKILLAILGLATVVITGLKQYNSPQRRKERLIRKVIDTEYEFRKAVAQGNADRASSLSDELDRLRREIRLYPD